MEPTAKHGESSPAQTEFAFGKDQGKDGRPNEVQNDLSADPETLPALPAQTEGPAQNGAEAIPAVWIQRLGLVLYLVFCIELGMVLIVLPWKSAWTSNALLAGFPALRAVFNNYFLRGIVTGLGLVDLWLGISAAVHYREREPGATRE